MDLKNLDLQSNAQLRPKYQRVRDHLYTEIHSGRLAPGHALPTEAKLAESLGLSRQTVRQAFAELEDDGIIIRVRGRGTFVTTEQQRQVRKSLKAFALLAPVLNDPFIPSLVTGFEDYCSSASYQTLSRSSGNDVYRQGDQILQFIDERVGGIAMVPVAPHATPAHQIRQLHENLIPIVYCHRAVPDVSAPCVTWSGEAVGYAAAEALHAAGHRRIGSMLAYRGEMATRYMAGLRDYLGKQGLQIPENHERYYDCAVPGPDTVDLVREQLTAMLAGPAPPTAVFCGNQIEAEHIYLLAIELGIKVPTDLSIIHFGSTQRRGALAHRLARIAVDEHEVGVVAGRLLAEIREGKRALNSNEKVILPVTYMPAESVGPPKVRS